MNSFGIQKFHVANGKAQHALKMPWLKKKKVLGWGTGGGFFHFSFVPKMLFSSSQWVPIRFPMCFPRVFPIPPHFNPICFAQSRPLLTYIGGPKEKTLNLFIESSILGSLHSLNLFLSWANQIGSLQKKRELDLWGTPNYN
jgi:hypothetical protein